MKAGILLNSKGFRIIAFVLITIRVTIGLRFILVARWILRLFIGETLKEIVGPDMDQLEKLAVSAEDFIEALDITPPHLDNLFHFSGLISQSISKKNSEDKNEPEK